MAQPAATTRTAAGATIPGGGTRIPVSTVDIDGMATVIQRALDMGETERRARMSALRQRVRRRDVHRWAESFIERPASDIATELLAGGQAKLKVGQNIGHYNLFRSVDISGS